MQILLFVGLVPRGTEAADDLCLQCHLLLEDNASAAASFDIHLKQGMTCAVCHGGDPTTEDMAVSMGAESGFIGVPAGNQISNICAGCHADKETLQRYGSNLPTDQDSLLSEGPHAQRSLRGNARILQCTSCHGYHGLVPASDRRSPVHPLNIVKTCNACHGDAAYMRKYNPSLPVDQREKYRTSVHGMLNREGDPNAAECSSCHGSHEILPADDVRSAVYPTNIPYTCAECHSDAEYMEPYSLPTDQLEKYSAGIHGQALLGKHDLAAPACNSCHGNHAAIPPGVESISKVCGTCHALNAELFSASPHGNAFSELGLPECETCHGNHDIIAATNELIGVSEDAVCVTCHSEEDAGFAFATAIRFQIDSLETAERTARLLVEDAEQKGMEVTEAEFRLRDVRQARFEVRTTIHSFNAEETGPVLARGFGAASAVAEEAQIAIDEFYFRRIGFGVSTLIITILAVSLYMYIRRLERNQEVSA